MQIGDMVYFWTGRGSHGYAVIREFKGPLVLLDPEPDATVGSDANSTYWIPRDKGVPRDQIDTAPAIWFTNF